MLASRNTRQSFLLLSLFGPHIDSTGVRLRDC